MVFSPRAPGGGAQFIQVAPDDRCYYRTIQGAPSNAPSDPWRTIYVDCPKELDDPAFDACVGGRLEGVRGAKRCLCTGEGGEGWAAPCPK